VAVLILVINAVRYCFYDHFTSRCFCIVDLHTFILTYSTFTRFYYEVPAELSLL